MVLKSKILKNHRFLVSLRNFNFKEIFNPLKNAKAFLVCKKSKAFLSTLQISGGNLK